MYVNTAELIEITLGSYFTVTTEGAVCIKQGLVCSYNYTIQQFQ